MKCPNCGAMIRPGDRFCQYCGDTLEQDSQPQTVVVREIHHHYEPAPAPAPVVRTVYVTEPVRSSRSRLVSLLLCFFLGYLGIHKFYEGKIIQGILYLLTVGVFGLGWAVDILRLLFGHPVDGKGLRMTWS